MRTYFGLHLGLVALLVCLFAVLARGDDVTEEQIDLDLKSKTCPPQKMEHASICKAILARCAANPNYQCDREGSECLKKETALNVKINAYNKVYYACHKGEGSSSGSSEVARALAAAKEKAEGADEVNAEDQRRIEAGRPEAVEQRERVDEERRAWWLNGQIQACKNNKYCDCAKWAGDRIFEGQNFNGILNACNNRCRVQENLCIAKLKNQDTASLEAELNRARAEERRQADIAQNMASAANRRQFEEGSRRAAAAAAAAAAAEAASQPSAPSPSYSPSSGARPGPTSVAPAAPTYYPPAQSAPYRGGSVNCGGPGCAVH
jgi:hypothetical protein